MTAQRSTLESIARAEAMFARHDAEFTELARAQAWRRRKDTLVWLTIGACLAVSSACTWIVATNPF